MGSGRRAGVLLMIAALVLAGCGKKKQPTDADLGDPAASKTVRVEAVHTWLDPDATKPYDDSAVAIVRNNGDKIADNVTLKLTWPNGYSTKQDEAIVIPPGKQGVFILGPFDAPPDLKGEPKAEAFVDSPLQQGGTDVPVEMSGFKQSGCSLSGKVTNKFEKSHPGVNAFVAGLRDGEIVTGGSVFFEEPGLEPGKSGSFEATLEPLCPEGKVDEWVAFPNLSVEDLTNP